MLHFIGPTASRAAARPGTRAAGLSRQGPRPVTAADRGAESRRRRPSTAAAAGHPDHCRHRHPPTAAAGRPPTAAGRLLPAGTMGDAGASSTTGLAGKLRRAGGRRGRSCELAAVTAIGSSPQAGGCSRRRPRQPRGCVLMS